KLLPIAGLLGDEDQERVGLGDGIEQGRLPEMPVAQMCLIDEHIGATQGILDRMLEVECDSAVWSVIAQEDVQHSSHPQELLNCVRPARPERVQDTRYRIVADQSAGTPESLQPASGGLRSEVSCGSFSTD